MNKLFFGVLFLVSWKHTFSQSQIEGKYVLSNQITDKISPFCDSMILHSDNTFSLYYSYFSLGKFVEIEKGVWTKKKNQIRLNTLKEKIYTNSQQQTFLISKQVNKNSFSLLLTSQKMDLDIYLDKIQINMLVDKDTFKQQFILYKSDTVYNCTSYTQANQKYIQITVSPLLMLSDSLQIPNFSYAYGSYQSYPNVLKISFAKPKNARLHTKGFVLASAGFPTLEVCFVHKKDNFGLLFMDYAIQNKKMRIKKNTLIETYTNPITKKKEKNIYKKIPTL